MHLKLATLPLLAAAVPLATAQLHEYAKQAGMLYFGAATDTPGFRERAGFEAKMATYDAIFANNKEFGQTTPTNGMKWLFTEPERGVFNWTEGEVVASLAKKQGKLLRCHALVWHSQLAPWVEAQTNWTKDEMRDIITKHITAVAGHWKGQCYAWDVVNEALNDDGTWRQSIFYNILGTEYIKLAFKVAAEVDPQAKLYYNDYSLERPASNKTIAAKALVKMLKDEGIKIDGVGMQAHHTTGRSPTMADQITTIRNYAALGVEVAYTELDVRIELPLNDTGTALQNAAYTAAVGACVQVPACVGITLWDFYDPFSWVPPVFPGFGNALLWYDDFSKHAAYDFAIAALKNHTDTKSCSMSMRRS